MRSSLAVFLSNTVFAAGCLLRTIPMVPSQNSQICKTLIRMNSKEARGDNPKPAVRDMQHLTNSDSIGGWEKCWEQGLTPWDLGRPTPIILHLHHTRSLPKGRALVPGCGSLSSSSPNAKYLTFLKADFFAWHPTEMFDLIFDYTFFCAIEPSMRSAWGRKIRDILKSDGELITLMFPFGDHVGGPPYKTSIAEDIHLQNIQNSLESFFHTGKKNHNSIAPVQL